MSKKLLLWAFLALNVDMTRAERTDSKILPGGCHSNVSWSRGTRAFPGWSRRVSEPSGGTEAPTRVWDNMGFTAGPLLALLTASGLRVFPSEQG